MLGFMAHEFDRLTAETKPLFFFFLILDNKPETYLRWSFLRSSCLFLYARIKIKMYWRRRQILNDWNLLSRTWCFWDNHPVFIRAIQFNNSTRFRDNDYETYEQETISRISNTTFLTWFFPNSWGIHQREPNRFHFTSINKGILQEHFIHPSSPELQDHSTTRVSILSHWKAYREFRQLKHP